MAPADIRITAGGSYSISVNGALTAIGDGPSQKIRIHSASGTPGRQDWAGIFHYGPGDVTLKHVSVENGYRGLWILNTANVDEINIDSSEFKQSFFAGVQNDRDTTTLVSIKSTRFEDISNHGIYIYKGRTVIDGCQFRDTLLNGVRFEAGNSPTRMIAGQIKNCSFDALRSANASGVYIGSIKSNHAPSGILLHSNTFGGQWLGPSPNNQTAIYVYNCDAELTLFNNRIDGEGSSGSFKPAYGILNYSTKTHITGEYVDSSEPSIDRAKHGVYCFSSSSSDPNYAWIRRMKIATGQYGVYVYTNSKVNLTGTSPCDSINAITRVVSEGGYNVYNQNGLNPSFEIPAENNYWGCPGCEDSIALFYGSIDVLPDWITGRQAPPEEWCGGSPKLALEPISSVNVRQLTETRAENYPNPFNSGTTISFALTISGNVDIVIYNVLGQRIRNLVQGHYDSGTYSVSWDGRDGSGNSVASGVYFYRLATDELQLSRKMVIVK